VPGSRREKVGLMTRYLTSDKAASARALFACARVG
jgi:hypothetical protein